VITTPGKHVNMALLRWLRKWKGKRTESRLRSWGESDRDRGKDKVSVGGMAPIAARISGKFGRDATVACFAAKAVPTVSLSPPRAASFLVPAKRSPGSRHDQRTQSKPAQREQHARE
jgi:hypothetical protein